MRILKRVVIVRTINISRDDRSEVASVLLVVCLVLDINHTLSVSITKVGLVRRAVMDHGFINGVGSLVRENAGGKTRNNLLDLYPNNFSSYPCPLQKSI
jgi:hypothetical protein